MSNEWDVLWDDVPKEKTKKEEPKREVKIEQTNQDLVKEEIVKEIPKEISSNSEQKSESDSDFFADSESFVEENAPKEVQEVSPTSVIKEGPIENVVPHRRAQIVTEDFDTSEISEQGHICITIAGGKGDSKTASAFSLPGTIAVLSFDQMAYPVKESMYAGDSRIHVYDPTRYFMETEMSQILDSAVRTFKYIDVLLDEIREKHFDWIVIDGSEKLVEIAEYVMRARNNLSVFGGVNMLLWKERKMYLKQIHRKAMASCKKGLVYTTYLKEEVLKRENDRIIDSKTVPHWVGIQLEETQVTIHVDARDDGKGNHRFIAIVENSKSPLFKTGTRVDITVDDFSKIGKEPVGLAKAFNLK